MSQQSDYLVAYGPSSNCTLALCDVTQSVYQYQPSLPANATFIALFCVNLIIHAVQGSLYPKSNLAFAILMVLGCIDEAVGYGGRIMLHSNPFSFSGFLMQIICITTAPVFYSAAIYLTLSKTCVAWLLLFFNANLLSVQFLGVQYSRFRPSLFLWLFVPCDIMSLALQSAGGALSSTSSGSSQVGVDVALAGLSFQVFTLLIFVALSVDYALRWQRAAKTPEEAMLGKDGRFRVFITFLSLAIVLIIARCCYRIDELSQGYSGPLISNEGLFIGLEGVLVLVAAYCLNIGHPGFGLESHLIGMKNAAAMERSTEMAKHNASDDF